ncbi:unnamed protein product [Diamesa hyperborea]
MPLIAELTGDENSGENSRTFVFEDESHTLGNVLKSIVGRYPDVEFCGYTVPHPAESKMHFRIQAQSNKRAIDILRRGLQDLQEVCNHTLTTFGEAMENQMSE